MADQEAPKAAQAPILKPTDKVDPQEVILALLHKREGQQDQIQQDLSRLLAKVEAARIEGQQRGAEQHVFNTRIDTEVRTMRHEARNIAQRLIGAESELEELKKARDAVADRSDPPPSPHGPRSDMPSASDLEQAAAVGEAMSHVINLDTKLATVKSEVDKTREELRGEVVGRTEALKAELDAQNTRSAERKQEQDRVNHALAAALGLDYQKVVAPPPDDPVLAAQVATESKPKANLAKVASENRVGTIMAFLAFMTALLQLLAKHL